MSQPRAERLAAALKQAMANVGEVVDVVGELVRGSSAKSTDDLGTEVFQALQVASSAAWGDTWLSESESNHLAILGGEEDWDQAQLCLPGAVAALFELLTELCVPRVSVVLGGAAVLHREAQKRGLELHTARSLWAGGALRARNAFASLKEKAKQVTR